MMPGLIWNMEGESDVYLTFDDGPTPGNTEWILDTLARYDARATFFCLGKNAEQYPETYRKIVDAGHKVGNHTYSHQKGWRMGVERYVEDVDLARQFIQSDLFRPPYGRIKPSQAKRLAERYTLVMWDVISRDYSNLITPRQCTRNVLKHIRPGSIVVFHDSPKSARNMRYTLPRVLEYLKEKGIGCSGIEI